MGWPGVGQGWPPPGGAIGFDKKLYMTLDLVQKYNVYICFIFVIYI